MLKSPLCLFNSDFTAPDTPPNAAEKRALSIIHAVNWLQALIDSFGMDKEEREIINQRMIQITNLRSEYQEITTNHRFVNFPALSVHEDISTIPIKLFPRIKPQTGQEMKITFSAISQKSILVLLSYII